MVRSIKILLVGTKGVRKTITYETKNLKWHFRYDYTKQRVIKKSYPEVLNLALEEMAGPRPLENHLSVLAEHPTLTVLQTTETKSKIKSESDRGEKK